MNKKPTESRQPRRRFSRAATGLVLSLLVISVLAAIAISQYADYTLRTEVSEGPSDDAIKTSNAELEHHSNDIAGSEQAEVSAEDIAEKAAAEVAADAWAADGPDGSGASHGYDHEEAGAELSSIEPLPRAAVVPPPQDSAESPSPVVPPPALLEPEAYLDAAAASPPPADAADMPQPALAWLAKVDGGNRDWCGPQCPRGSPALTSGQEYRAALGLGLSLEPGAHVSATVGSQAADASPENPRTFWVIPLFDEDKLKPGAEKKTAFKLIYKGAATPAPEDLAIVPFSVRPGATGCAHIWVSVWDSDLQRAIDAFVVSVSLATVVPAEPCVVDDGRRTLVDAGAESVLDLLPMGDDGPSQRVAGIHAFELTVGNEASSRVVVVGKDRGAPLIYGWDLNENLSTNLDSDRVAPILLAARNGLAESDASARRKAYRKLGDVIRAAIFQAGKQDADAAFELLQRTVTDEPDATISARFVKNTSDSRSAIFYIPLRFLAKAKHGLPADGFHVVQPLSGRKSDPKACIARWTIAASPFLGLQDSTDQADVDAYDRLLNPTVREPWRGAVITDIDKLRDYFHGFYLQTPLQEHESEALIILSHHGQTNGILYDLAGEPILPIDVRRKFPDGSVAFLAMCATSEAKSAAGVMSMLAQSGFDAILASPFQVSDAYSARLIDSLMQQVDLAYRKSEPRTIAELFDLAASAAADTYVGKPEAGQQALEFVVAGNPNLRLCKFPVKEN